MPYPKGKPKSEESKRKASESCRAAWTDDMKRQRSERYLGDGNPFHGKRHSRESLQKMSDSHVGVEFTEEQRLKISKSLMGNKRAKGNRGLWRPSEEHMRWLRERKGERSPAWKGGVTKEHALIRNGSEYREWRTSVFVRDDYTCCDCNSRGGKGEDVRLQAHHLKPFSSYPELRFDPLNGVTLCIYCHRNRHKKVAYV